MGAGAACRGVAERRRAIRAVRALLPDAPAGKEWPTDQALASATPAELAVERDRLDGEIADLIAWTHSSDAHGDVATAIALLRQHVHDELKRDMKLTKKPFSPKSPMPPAEVKTKAAADQGLRKRARRNR